MDKKWKTENNNKVSFQLDEYHKLYVERTKNGFSIKMFDERGHNYRPEEPILLYHKKISDFQLGHIGLPNNER